MNLEKVPQQEVTSVKRGRPGDESANNNAVSLSRRTIKESIGAAVRMMSFR